MWSEELINRLIHFGFLQMELLVILYCGYYSFVGIWCKKGLNKQIRNQIFVKQSVWILYRVINYFIHTYVYFVMYSKYKAFQISCQNKDHNMDRMVSLDEMYFEVAKLTGPVQYIDSCWGFLFIIIYLCDPDFQTVLTDLFEKDSNEAKMKQLELNKLKQNQCNNFLFSSLNLQSVCSILSGIKEALKESKDDDYLFDDDKTVRFKIKDYKDEAKFKIKRIQVLKDEYFETDKIEDKNQLSCNNRSIIDRQHIEYIDKTKKMKHLE